MKITLCSINCGEAAIKGPCPPIYKFFKSYDSFKEHCNSHFLNPEEPWDRVIEKKKWDTARKKWERQHVIEQNLYETLAKKVEEGLQWAIARPVYVCSRQTVNQSYQRVSIFFLTPKGYVIIADKNVIKSAYFTPTYSRKKSTNELFAHAWKHIRKKVIASEYLDTKYNHTVQNQAITWFSSANWDACPLPRKPVIKKQILQFPWDTAE